MTVVVGPGDYVFAQRLAERLGARFIPFYEKVFPDGELYVRVSAPEALAKETVVIASTTYPEQSRMVLKSMLMINAVRQCNPERVVLVTPYMAYSRQDKVFLPGEPISACVVLRAFSASGADSFLTVDIHSPRVLECFEGPAKNILVSDILAKEALKYLENPVVIAPDKGALERASLAARTLGLEWDYMVKERDRVTGQVTYKPKELSVSGRDVIIVDDIISTGGTIAELARVLHGQNARRITVVATHGLLIGEALRKLESAGVYKLILADTLGVRYDHPLIEYVDVTPVVASALRELIG